MNVQPLRKRPAAALFFALFALSGFSGLIYESIWTHYLKLFLGHAAYAQTLVLAIFMGGMAGGAWLCSHYSARWKNLFVGYAIAEGIIGLLSLVFHETFVRMLALAYDTIIPQLHSPLAVNAFKWGFSALLIMPQSVLLGMTFPLMSAAILRTYPENPGGSVALLYFTNSIGAAIGVLTSGFFLIKAVGLPGTMAVAGIINIALAIAVWWLARNQADEPLLESAASEAGGVAPVGGYRLMLVASLITGAASFIYEIGWIRMLSLVLGSSTHSFELMLSAFISGLAFGGLWIRRRIDLIDHPLRFLAQVQVIMGLMALSTLLFYGNTFAVMQWILRTVPKTEAGYALFNLAGNGIALGIMLPTTFCAGMTLPLITYTLLKERRGEKSIGAVYGANTIGAILGIFLAIHVGMPFLGIKGLITLGACLDIGLGLVLLWRFALRSSARIRPAVVTVVSIGAIVATLLFVNLDPYKMASGVYRFGALLSPEQQQILFHRDGKTATVTLDETPQGIMSIRTNGKVDATINVSSGGKTTLDESTMVLAAALPLALHPQAKTAANIGLGSGLTTHTLLGSERLQRVDTVEIEKYMAEAARYFGSRVERVYQDSRSTVHIDDAKTFFSTNNRKYDIIVSEPSNPWVSGVAGLFSAEFYALINRHLESEGIFVQWLQLYEINVELVSSVLKSLSTNFRDYEIYASNNGDLVVVATNRKTLGVPDADIFRQRLLAADLARVDIHNLRDLYSHRIAGKKFMDRLINTFPIGANSDYYPVLDQNAARARFMNETAAELISLGSMSLPLAEVMEGPPPSDLPAEITPTSFLSRNNYIVTAMALRDYFLDKGNASTFLALPADTRRNAEQTRRLFWEPGSVVGPYRKVVLFNTAKEMVAYLTPREFAEVSASLETGPAARLLDPVEQDYLAFFKALGQRDPPAIARLARKLLQSDRDVTPVRRHFLVAAGMLGSLASGKNEESRQLWQSSQQRISVQGELPFLFRALVAMGETDRLFLPPAQSP